MPLSPKQQSYLFHSDAFLNIAHGAIRSGKTHAALRRFSKYAIDGPKGTLAIFGVTHRTIRDNVIDPLMTINEAGTVKYNQGAGELHLFGRRCVLIGANDVRAERKVRGLTLAGTYMNEVTLYPREVFDQAIARHLQTPGAKIFADCNPDSPYHWLKSDYLDADHPKTHLKHWRFRLPDNPILQPETVEMFKDLYGRGTLFYRRNIDGEWVAAEGAIYPMLDVAPGGAHVVTELPQGLPERVLVGVDYGTATVTTFLLLGRFNGIWYVMREYYHDAQKSGIQRTDAEYAHDYISWIGDWSPLGVEVDPSAASFKLELRKRGVKNVRDADNEVIAGIRRVATALTAGKLKIHASCTNLLREMSGYAWDSKQQEKGVRME